MICRFIVTTVKCYRILRKQRNRSVTDTGCPRCLLLTGVIGNLQILNIKNNYYYPRLLEDSYPSF